MSESPAVSAARATTNLMSESDVDRIVSGSSSWPRHTSSLTAGIAVVALAALPGCASSATTESSPDSRVPVSATPSATPEVRPTFSAEQQRAVEDATEAVRAYEQTFYDIVADSTPYLNDMNSVAVDPQLDRDLRSLQRIVVGGKTTVESAGPVVIDGAEVLKVNRKAKVVSMTALVCVDATAAHGMENGKSWTGRRQQMRYVLVQTSHLPAPGWAVSRVLPTPGHEGPVQC